MTTRTPRHLSRRTLLQTTMAGVATGVLGGLKAPIAWSQEGRTLTGRTYTSIDTFDPAHYGGVPEEEVGMCIYNKLTHYTPGRSWQTHLQAAERLEQLDPTHVRFVLKPGQTWSNGFGEITAEDVKFSFERIVDPATESPNKPDMGSLAGVEIEDTYSGVIVLNEPFAPLLNIALPYITGTIVCKRAWEEAGGRMDGIPPTVAGPYQVESWTPAARTVLVPNPEYSGPDKAAFERIEILVVDDEKTAEIAFEAGDIDFTRVSLTSLDALQANLPPNSTIEEFPSLYYVWLGMNTQSPKLADPRVRRAIQHAIDVPSVLEAAYFGIAKPSTGIIAPGLVGHRPANLVPPQADFAVARELLQDAEVGQLRLTLDVLNKAQWVTAAQVIQATLANVGIDVTINQSEAGTFWSLGKEAQGDSWQNLELVLNRFSMTPDPYYATSWFTTEQVGIWNWERFSNPEFDRLHKAAAAEGDSAKRDAMYRQMQDLMEQSGAYRFLTHEANPVIYRNTIQPALRPDGLPLYRYFKPA
ncbi:MAG: ABC transporter substrate-binding protein [Candidatus Competibacterales bacterium]